MGDSCCFQVCDPYDLTALHIALRSDGSSTPPLPPPSSLRRSIRSERPSYLSSSALSSHFHPSPSSSPHSSPPSPSITDPCTVQQPSNSHSDGIGRTAGPASVTMPAALSPHMSSAARLLASAVPVFRSSHFPSAESTPLSVSSTVTCTPSSSTSSFSLSPSSLFFSPSDNQSSLHFAALYSPPASHTASLASLASLTLGSPHTVASPGDSLPSHHSTPSSVNGSCTHRPLRIRRKRQLGGGEQSEREQHHRQHHTHTAVAEDTSHSPTLLTSGQSSLSPRFSSHRVLPPRPPRLTLRTLRGRHITDGRATTVRADNGGEQRADCIDDDSVAEEAEAAEAAEMRGKRRRRWPFSPPSNSHTTQPSHTCPHSSPDRPDIVTLAASPPPATVTAVSPLHRLRRLDPVVSSMHAITLPHSQPDSSDERTAAAAADDCTSHCQPPAAAIVKQRQSVLDRLKALT